MPAFVGPIKIENSGNGGVSFGDAFAISPKVSEKLSCGSGFGSTGDFNKIHNKRNATNLYDQTLIDQPDLFNS
ncbi:spore germination protein [Metabacillus arenae]|uniref:Spore germination protein n=1 Tax=Metabacillus arenae TaxID=2771434 RepID=A0A926NMR8_9BACI|nr:spore germination protein [Metabacillus arenae]MBD1380862.1 spore germination protein [Metabacillus arenae]